MAKNLFIPVMGTEERVQQLTNSSGSVYFTTDTRKIYLDVNDSKLPMGGNVGLFYGKMKPSGFVADDQKEFIFTVDDIIRENDDDVILIPNVNDLILNDDGCFYKVLSVDGTTFNTEKLTIAGTGGGSGSGGGPSTDGSLTSFSVGKVEFSSTNILQGGSCILRFLVKVTDDIGDYVTDNIGYYEIYINGAPAIKNIRLKGIASGDVKDSLSSYTEAEINSIDIAPYLPVTQDIQIGLRCYDADGNIKLNRSLSKVTVSSMILTWNYDNKHVNHWTESTDFMTLSWSVTGPNLVKNTYINIDEGSINYLIGSGTNDTYTKDLNFADYGLTHGSHIIKMWAETEAGVPTDPVYRNVVVAQEGNNNTIISICLFEKELQQYNTTAIPVYIYSKNNIAGTYSVSLIEDSILKTQWNNVPNSGADASKSTWYYTPLYENDATTLTVSSGGSSKSVVVSIKGLGIKLEEKPGYAFKFKANEFSSDTDIQNWTAQNGKYKVNFSSNFDWFNGGVGSERDEEFGDRQFVAVKAGTEMEINYPVWKQNAPGAGKHLKVIFKTTNCRNYDATALTCKVDKKIIHVDKTEEFFLLTEAETNLDYAEYVRIDNNNQLEMMNIKNDTLNAQEKDSVTKFKDKYVRFENSDGTFDIYQCAMIYPDPKENPDEFYVTWYKTKVTDSFNGLEIKVQNATMKTNNISLSTQYCEDTYIELEIEFTAASSGKKYAKMWIDGVPCGYSIYDPESDLFQLSDPTIKIGSPDCDVQIYLIKLYESELSIKDHMNNFYVDAPNAEEMVRRYNRNDIMNKSNDSEIDLYELAKKNPDCLVHHYVVPSMPTTKKTKIYPCDYYQYQGSATNKYRAEGVMIKVQGTTSEKYVVSAANLDTDFNYTDGNTPSGIIDGLTGNKLEGWAMSNNAIPINFTCTKVNVASCENINNYLNQEWYNRFQPYQSVLRCKNPKARDTMQFTPGVIFVTDKNKITNKPDGVGDNVFKDTPGYLENPYAKMYSLGQMGNSKNNIDVFHDTSNPLECCIEVADNQKPQQCMINDEYNYGDIGASAKIFEFRYPKEGASQEMIDGWNNFVSWMARSNPSPKYQEYTNVTTEKEYKDFAINKKTFEKIVTYKFVNDEYEETEYNPAITTYYVLTDHKWGYDNRPLPDGPKPYGIKKFTGYRAENQKRPDGSLWQKDYNPLIAGCEVKEYDYRNFVTRDKETNEMIEDPNNKIAQPGGFTHDTYWYRMAKMLDECEDHLVMDSILYHYLFIERHCMIDNVAKNTFWSTEDCQHWNMVKDYDNDTADGNDNQGKLTRTYGMEPTDSFNTNETVFNASRSVWFNFCHGLSEALEHMYVALANRKVALDDGTLTNVWDYQEYLKLASKIQSTIPERCWIEDYQRKYFRPNEVYGDPMYNDMLEGGQKKYQRKQFETYQDIYLNSKYEYLDDDRFLFRPTGKGLLNANIPVEVYSDCYVYSNTGSNIKKERVKRNITTGINCPEDELNNAAMYIHPGSNITRIGTMERPLGIFAPTQMGFSQGRKLREVIYGHENQYTENTGLQGGVSFEGSAMLEKLYMSGIKQSNGTALDLHTCTSLKELDVTESTFTAITLPNNAPLSTVKLQKPTALVASNLFKLQEFKIADYSSLRTIRLENMDTTLPNFSKNIISTAMKHVSGNNIADVIQYKITEAQWSLDKAEEMNDTNILLLDKMLDEKYSVPVIGDDNLERLPYSAALTGDLTISSEAYDGNNPLAIYNKYVNDRAFANLDMDFESTNAKLYDVIIYDGDNQPYWKKKTTSGTVLDAEFLSYGPNGQFKAQDIYKSPSDEFEYTFLNIWEVKYDDGTSTTIENAEPIGITIDKNLYIYPKFEALRRSYEITIKAKNPITKEEKDLIKGSFEYGTSFEDILKSAGDYLIPYVSDPNGTLSLYEGYDFKGYSASENSKIILDEAQYKVINKATFYAVFEYTKEINKVVHPEWFTVVNIDSNQYEDEAKFKTVGAIISPVTINIGGKITIPSTIEHEGSIYPVIGITGFSKQVGQKYTAAPLTHVFMDGTIDNTLYLINDNCFYNATTLQYFDFDACAVRSIGQNAFDGCSNLYVTNFGKQLYNIESYAFRAALHDSVTTINIPGSVKKVGSYALANNLASQGTRILNIGSEDHKSDLVLTWNNNGGNIVQEALRQNQAQRYHAINFWSNVYYSLSDIVAVGSDMTVGNWFLASSANSGGGNIILMSDGTIYLNGAQSPTN